MNSNTNVDSGCPLNTVGNVPSMGVQNSNGQPRYGNGEPGLPFSVDRTTSATMDELESGRR